MIEIIYNLFFPIYHHLGDEIIIPNVIILAEKNVYTLNQKSMVYNCSCLGIQFFIYSGNKKSFFLKNVKLVDVMCISVRIHRVLLLLSNNRH
jgi:hypothetical protein